MGASAAVPRRAVPTRTNAAVGTARAKALAHSASQTRVNTL
jgi:hypothetical protein